MNSEETMSRFKLLWSGDKTVRDSIIAGNMHWVLRLVQEMDNRSNIPLADFVEAGRVGLTKAVDRFDKPELAFAPNDSLKDGYAIWWVFMWFAKLARARGNDYEPSSNTCEPSAANPAR